MMIRCALSALLLLVVAGQASADVELKHKYKAGSKFTSEVIGQVEQTLSIAGMDVETKAETITRTKYEVGAKNDNGETEVKTKVDSMQINMEVMGGTYNFDSANPDNTGSSQLEMLRDVHKAIAKSETKLTIGEDGYVADLEMGDLDVESLPEQVKMLARSQLETDYLKKQANQTIDQLPTGAVKKGDTWDRSESVDFGGGQIMTFKKTYKYEGTVDEAGKQLHKITAKVLGIEFEIDAGSGLPLKLKESKLKPGDSAAEILFDAELGQIVKSNSNVQVVGELTFEAGGQELPAKLDLRMKAESSITQ